MDRLIELNSFEMYYKFVIDEMNIKDTINFILSCGYMPNMVYLMPKTVKYENDNITNKLITVEACKAYGFRYSPRLHVDIWGKKEGV